MKNRTRYFIVAGALIAFAVLAASQTVMVKATPTPSPQPERQSILLPLPPSTHPVSPPLSILGCSSVVAMPWGGWLFPQTNDEAGRVIGSNGPEVIPAPENILFTSKAEPIVTPKGDVWEITFKP